MIASFRWKLAPVLALLSVLATNAVRAEKEWTVEDYLRELPATFKTHSGDFQNEPTAATTITDIRNGYIAYLSQPPQPGSDSLSFPIFEIAVFKPAKGEPIVVVANTIADSVCTRHETFFLRKRGAEWQDVRAQVLPKLSLQNFFKEPGAGAKLKTLLAKLNPQGGPSPETLHHWLHFAPPRQGTRVKVSLELCNDVPDELAEEVGRELDSFLGKKKTIWLQWDKQKGVFRVAD